MSLVDRAREALRAVKFPGMSRDIVSFGFVETIDVRGEDSLFVELKVPTQNPGAGEQIREAALEALGDLSGVGDVEVVLQVVARESPQQASQKAVSMDPKLVPGVDHIVAIARR